LKEAVAYGICNSLFYILNHTFWARSGESKTYKKYAPKSGAYRWYCWY